MLTINLDLNNNILSYRIYLLLQRTLNFLQKHLAKLFIFGADCNLYQSSRQVFLFFC